MSALPEGWSRHESKSAPGKFFFAHTQGAKTWETPTASTPTSDDAAAASAGPATVRVLHILRKHAGSRRPSSWRVETITQSKAEATAQISAFRESLQECADRGGASALRQMFAEIANKESDCSSAEKFGDLGKFGRGAMQKPFEDASFSLAVGEMSGIVDTDSGIHIILRVA